MSTVALLPKAYEKKSRIQMNLPDAIGEWWGVDLQVSQKEHEVLGYDAQFARKLYEDTRGGEVLTSIVLSGPDMMRGIHRPERCLNAQGWAVGHGTSHVVQLADGTALPVTRLRLSRTILASNTVIPINSICLYFFVGADQTASTHLGRVWIDSRDRILKGEDQRWAMVMLTAEITKARDKFGRDEEQTDVLLDNFVKQLAPKILGLKESTPAATNLPTILRMPRAAEIPG